MRNITASVLAVLLFWGRLGHAETGIDDEQKVEPQFGTLQQLVDALGNGDAEKPASTEGEDDKKKDNKPKVKVYGFVQVFYKHRFETNGDGTTEPGVFRDQRVRIGVKGKVLPYVGYEVEVDPRAPEVSGILRDGFIYLTPPPNSGWPDFITHQEFRIGQQKTQFGYENRESSTRLFTVNRAELSDSLSRGSNLRDIGIGWIGNWPLGEGFRLEHSITLVNGAGTNVQADDTKAKNLWGRIGGRYKTEELTLRVGVSGAYGDQQEPPGSVGTPADGTQPFVFNFERVGTDVEIDHRWAFLAAEYVQGWDSPPAEPGFSEKRDGYYVLLAGKTPWDVGPLVRYDTVEEFERWTAGAFYGLPDERFRVLFNYEFFLKDESGKRDDRMYVWTQVRF